MRVLLISGDKWHPCQIPMEGVNPLRGKGFDIDDINDTADFDPAILANYDVVIICKEDHISQENHNSWKSEAVQDAFIEYVENGGGLLVSHSGVCAGTVVNTDKLDKLAGARFVYHPKNCPVFVQTVKPHPVTEGVGAFCEEDEFYRLEILADDVDILAACYAAAQGEESKYESDPYHNCPAGIEPCVFVRTQGKGRVCVLTPGHTLKVWENPEFQRLLVNSLRWCAGG